MLGKHISVLQVQNNVAYMYKKLILGVQIGK